MSTAYPDSVETWAPLFTQSFSDDQILNPTYMLSQGGPSGIWCKLCDAAVTGERGDAHVARHTRELKSWRKGRRVEAERRADEKRTATRQEKELERKVFGTEIPEKRRLANRVTSARYKLKHPEKHGKEKWTKREESELHDSLQAAVKALDDYREKEGKE